MKRIGRKSALTVLGCALSCTLIVGLAQSQCTDTVAEPTAARVREAMSNVKSGEFALVDVDVIQRARAVEAIGDLEKQFKLRTEPVEKARIAQVLVFLGLKKNAYWNYLERLVNAALDSSAPSVVRFNSEGRREPGLSTEFARWAEEQRKSPADAAEEAVYITPGYFLVLGWTGDARAIPLLRRGLSSPNYQIVAASASGLAELNDKGSIGLIIAACRRAPAEVVQVIAEPLVCFDDPEAQKAVDTFVSKDHARMLRKARKAREDK